MSEPSASPSSPSSTRYALAAALFAATCVTTLHAGAGIVLERAPRGLSEVVRGWTFALPLMSILLSHELGHYIAARLHRVPVSPPYFLPIPAEWSLLGTMGAVIHMPDRIRTRRALFDIGAAGPLAGLVVALPVLAYGLSISEVRPIPPNGPAYLLEGRSLLYLALLRATHGTIPPGSDVFLSPPAMAGWAGLLVTMINLIPIGQLDGGHVAYALFGTRQDRASTLFLRLLPGLGIAVGAFFVIEALRAGKDLEAALPEAVCGMPWIVWTALLLLLRRLSGPSHPRTDDDALVGPRRALAVFTLALFPLLFMPFWMRAVEP
ncbi:MAG: site-2 protease family protein [Polyangiales bacterium]